MGQKLKIAGWISVGVFAGALTTVSLQTVARSGMAPQDVCSRARPAAQCRCVSVSNDLLGRTVPSLASRAFLRALRHEEAHCDVLEASLLRA